LSLDGILASALTALQTNAAALRVVSNNIANMNAPGYDRRLVEQAALNIGGQISGVTIADVQRVTNNYLMAEVLRSGSAASMYGTQSGIFGQLSGILGQPGDGTSVMSQLENVFAALGQASLSPNAVSSQLAVLGSYQNFASTVSTLSSQLANLQAQTDQQVVSQTGSVNGLLKQIYDLNTQIQTAMAQGDDSTGLLDERDQAVQQLSQYMDVRTIEQPNGQLTVMTTDGVSLVGDTYAQLSYAGGGASSSYGPIMLETINPATGEQIGNAQALDPHLSSGSLKGLIVMRDQQLVNFQQELGNFARQAELAFNAQSNANTSFPPPTSLNGRDTGLLSSDALNFTGKTTIAVTDSNGNLVSRIDVDFDAGTMSVDGGAPISIGSTIGDFTMALNTALGSNGTASFQDGKLSISANGSNGIVVQDNATTPSSRSGYGFSQFFGLNDIFQSAAPSILSTGLSAGDAGGFAAGGTMGFTLKGPNGETKQFSVTLTAGMTIGDIVNALNGAAGGAANFSLGPDGSLSMTPSPAYSGYQLNVDQDTTARGTTGMSFTQLFGLGVQQTTAQAQNFSVNPTLVASPQYLAFAQPSITDASVAGESVVTSGDARGILALQNIANAQQNFSPIGRLGTQVATLGAYAASWYQDVATQGAAANSNNAEQTDRAQEAQSRQSQVSGVNLDEELSNMMIYQQAYSAGARILQTVQQMYDTLLQVS